MSTSRIQVRPWDVAVPYAEARGARGQTPTGCPARNWVGAGRYRPEQCFW